MSSEVSILDDNVRYWIELAKYDLSSAKVMHKGRRYLYVGFMCHQATEKALKAYYTDKLKETPPYIHNLIRLSELTDLLAIYNEKQRQTVLSLNPLNIEARYPIQKGELALLLTKKYCKRLINDTEELLQWIVNKLSE